MHHKQGDTIGGWTLSRQLGQGGNGVVFEANKSGCVAAIKLLHATGARRLARFADEIKAMEMCKGLPGVLPLYESFLPTASNEAPPWLAMALATRLSDALGSAPSLDHVVIAIRGVAAALVSVHELGLSHRDIKPDNLFLLDDTWAVGDLGLADFDGKESSTAPMEKVGPMFYIAPEMLNNAALADGKMADVYSLAKTLWVLGTGQKYPLPGHQVASIPSMTMSAYVAHSRAPLLDPLLEAATYVEPSLRPTMCQFLRELDAWITPPAAETALAHTDVAQIKRLLEGRAARVQVKADADAIAFQRKRAQDLRMRERFRAVAVELAQYLTEASFLSVSLNIDNYNYGFEVSAAVPYEPTETVAHGIRITLHTGTVDPIGSRFRLSAWYRHSHATSAPTLGTVLWENQREFLAGGSDEETQVAAMTQDLRDQFLPAVTSVLNAAGIL